MFRLPGEGGDRSIVRWNLRPIIFGVEFQERIRSKAGRNRGPNRVRRSRFGGGRVRKGRSGWEGSVAPPEGLILNFQTH